MNIETFILLIGAVFAALASPLPSIFSHTIRQARRENLLLHAWETCMLYFSTFGMTLLSGMVFLILFAKLYERWIVLEWFIPVMVAIIALIDLEADITRGFGLRLFPPRNERIKWYRMAAQEHHPVILGSLAAAGELFTSGAVLLLVVAHLARLPGSTTIFHQFLPLLYYAAVFCIGIALLTPHPERETIGSYRKWSLLLTLLIVAATLWILFGS